MGLQIIAVVSGDVVVGDGREHVHLECPGEVARRGVMGHHDDLAGARAGFAHSEETSRHPDDLREVT